jgi:hypothetical protein
MTIVSTILAVIDFYELELFAGALWIFFGIFTFFIAYATFQNTRDAARKALGNIVEGKFEQVEILADSSYCNGSGCLVAYKYFDREIKKSMLEKR